MRPLEQCAVEELGSSDMCGLRRFEEVGSSNWWGGVRGVRLLEAVVKKNDEAVCAVAL